MNPQYLIAITILTWGIGSFFYKIANDNIHPIMVSVIVTALYIVLDASALSFLKFPKTLTQDGIVFSLLGGLSMAIGSLAYFFALKKGGAGEITTIVSLYPALTLVMSMLILKETVSIRQGIGIGLALISCILLGLK